MFKDVSWEECLERRDGLTVIDVRSPGEFEEATIPGSLNIPLFDNEERAEIGTIYKQVGVQAAKDRGLEIVSAKLPRFVKQFAEIPGNKAVFCWRGGMRSRTTATVLSLMGISSYRLSGGYRAYRQWVVEKLGTMTFKPYAYVIQGHTGSGKTAILRRLKQAGHPVLDLEGMAGHRGSVFGEIGTRARNQKSFDSLLVEDLMAYNERPYVLFEAESKRIGKVAIPDLLIAKRSKGHQITIELPVDVRVRHILQDYEPWLHAEECQMAFRHIRSRIHTPIASEIDTCLKTERYDRAVELLLTSYYDPLYTRSSGQFEREAGDFDGQTLIRASSLDEAYDRIEATLRERANLIRS